MTKTKPHAYIRVSMEDKKKVGWELMCDGLKVCDLTQEQLLDLAAQAVVSAKKAA
jgi:hypothetical protein